jgi:hypothetical protein
MRLKISFEDIHALFNYLDKDNRGEIGYENFTYLLEERWRGIDPIELSRNEMLGKLPKNPMKTSSKPILNIYDNCQSELEMIHKLEELAKDRLKVPLYRDEQLRDNTKINKNFVNILEISK